MLTLDFASDFVPLMGGAPWALLGCVSFEERSVAIAENVARWGTGPKRSRILCPLDTGSQWERECHDARGNQLVAMRALIDGAVTQFPLTAPDVDVMSVDVLDELLAEMGADGITTLVIDISAMPKACFYPVLKKAIRETHVRLLVTYAEPGGYGNVPLHSDPMQPPSTLAGLNTLVPWGGARLAWIPMLGFGSFFAQHVHESLVASGSLEYRIFPLVGFPGFDPSLYDRMLLDNGERLLSMLGTGHQIRDQFIFAPAWDPFGTRDAILTAMDTMPEDIAWVGSPLGPRPMALGMLLAALEKDLSIVVCQARSYHPGYSHGAGRIHLYPLRMSQMVSP